MLAHSEPLLLITDTRSQNGVLGLWWNIGARTTKETYYQNQKGVQKTRLELAEEVGPIRTIALWEEHLCYELRSLLGAHAGLLSRR